MTEEKAKKKPLHVIELRSTNIMRLKAVRITPDGSPLVIIGGRNEQGKTSVLESLLIGLRGADALPLEPVRHGASKADIVIDLGEFKVLKSISPKGVKLTVVGKDNVPIGAPQKFLDDLLSKNTFDPVGFLKLEPKKQDSILRGLVGFDTTASDQKRAGLYDARADINRDVKRREVELEAMPKHDDAPAELVDVSETAKSLEEANEKNTQRLARVDAAKRARDRVDAATAEIARKEAEVLKIKEELVTMRKQMENLEATAKTVQESVGEEISTSEFIETLKNAEAKNAKVRANQAHAKATSVLDAQKAKSKNLTEQMEALDAEKSAKLAKLKFPVEGLGFDEEAGPTLLAPDGRPVPLAQASMAQKLRASVAIGAAMNPRVRVCIVRDASLMDEDSLKLLCEVAREYDFQVWLERVGNKDPGAIIIEDGEILGAETEPEAPADAHEGLDS